jgi:hypothetical protein
VGAYELVSNTPSQSTRCECAWKDGRGVLLVEIDRPDPLVMVAIVVFRGIIAKVFLSRMPLYSEFFIFHLVTDIEISHFH